MKMRYGSKIVSVVSIAMVVLALVSDGTRVMKEGKEQVDHPQNFVVGGYVNPSTPGTPGFAAGVGLGPNGFCTFPGGCVPFLNPGGAIGGGSSGGGGVGSNP